VNDNDLNFPPGFPIPYQYTFIYQHFNTKEETCYWKFHWYCKLVEAPIKSDRHHLLKYTNVNLKSYPVVHISTVGVF